jgi:hypothetical protein
MRAKDGIVMTENISNRKKSPPSTASMTPIVAIDNEIAVSSKQE